MRVLVACEFSGIVREAFLRRGHDAYSCDLRFTAYYRSARHITGDVRPLLRQSWDLVIAHPPCTYLTNSGSPFLIRPGRIEKVKFGALLFLQCLNANAPRVCVENPIPHRAAKELIGEPYTQVIQPWQFGHGETKATCLWLKGLPPLVPTNVVEGREQRNRNLPPSANRRMLRSLTFHGIARAMAEQWG